MTNADPGLLALAFAVSIAEPHPAKIIPAANESFQQNHIQLLTNYKEQEKLLNHYNDCVTTRKRFLDMLGKIIFSLLKNSKFSRCEVVKRENSN